MWRPVSKCMMCNSTDLELHVDEEYYRCRRCGCSAGGANFWEDPIDTDTELDFTVEEIASDAVEHVTNGKDKTQITNKEKSIIAKSVAEAMKAALNEVES